MLAHRVDSVRGWADDASLLNAGATLKVAPRSIMLLQRQD